MLEHVMNHEYYFTNISHQAATLLPRPRRGLLGIVFTRSVCLCVCLSLSLSLSVSVCLADNLVFYFSAIRRDIDVKFIQDTYRVVLNSQVKGQGHRDGTLLFEGTVISQKLSHRKFQYFL